MCRICTRTPSRLEDEKGSGRLGQCTEGFVTESERALEREREREENRECDRVKQDSLKGEGISNVVCLVEYSF